MSTAENTQTGAGGFELRLVNPPDLDLDVGALLPEHLLGLTIDALQRMRLAQGRRQVALTEFFDVTATGDGAVTILGATRRLRRIGRGMTSGELNVFGEAGDELGAGLRGGVIRVTGSASDYVGSGMRGGEIHVSGHTGAFTGGALPYEPLGMRDGIIRIAGTVGPRAGDRMRRGLIVINGNAGPHCGANMIAGTIVVTGEADAGIGLGMRRGTILLRQPPPAMPATFNDCGSYGLAILALMSGHLRTIDRTAHRWLKAVHRVRRFVGDIGAGGQGEILVAEPAPRPR